MRHGLLPEAEIDRKGRLRRGKNRFARLEVIGGRDDDDIMDCTQRSEIVQGMVGRSECAIAHSRADANHFDRLIRIANVILDLLERPRREKAARGNRKDRLAGGGETRRDSDKVLFSDPHFNDLPGNGLAEGGQFSRTSRVAGDDQQVGIHVSQVQQRGREDL